MKLVLKKEGGRWRAWLADHPDTIGCGRRQSDAVAALMAEMIGVIPLAFPERFGVEVEVAPQTAGQD